MEFVEAIKRPFSDWKKLLIAALMYMIPLISIVTQFFGVGYLLECGKTAMKKTAKLPEWTDWGNLFVKGLVAFIISAIYFMPTVILILIVAGTTILTGFSVQNLGVLIGSLGVGMLLVLVVGIITAYVLPVAILTYASKGGFGSAFALKEVFAKAFTGQYLVAWLLSAVAGVVVMMVAGYLSALLALTFVLPLILSGLATAISGIIAMTLLGEAVGSAK
jgi:hypothetical protein